MHRHTAPLQPVVPPVVAPSRARRSKKAAVIMLMGCLLLAVLAVLLVPMLASGAAQPGAEAKVAAMAVPAESKVDYATLEQAQQAAGFVAALPTAVPEDTTVSAYRVVNGTVLEVEYKIGKNLVLFRTAPGAAEVSGDVREHTYTSTEEVNGVARTYAGVTEGKLKLAVWAAEGNSYAIVADSAVDADVMKAMAQSV